MAKQAPKVIVYGPNPVSFHRMGGVATHMRNLDEMLSRGKVPRQFFYCDIGLWRSGRVFRLIDTFGGVVRSSLKILLSTSSRSIPVHINTSLYPHAWRRDLLFVLACILRRRQILLQVHGGRYGTVRDISGWQWILGRATRLGVFPGPQWDEFEKSSHSEKLFPLVNMVEKSGVIRRHDDESTNFLFLGALSESKGVRTLVKSFARLREAQAVRLTLLGTGPLQYEIDEWVRDKQLSDRVAMPGHVVGKELDEYIMNSDVLVLPSDAEGLPLAVLECAERGLACIVTVNSAVPRLFKDGTDFLGVEPRNEDQLFQAMSLMTMDKVLLRRLAENGRNAVQSRFTFEAALKTYASFYDVN